MTEKEYIGIGSRKTPATILRIMRFYGHHLGSMGYRCRTGACVGPDQTFAEGTQAGGGEVWLFLPWASYEKEWIGTLKPPPRIRVVSEYVDHHAFQSVAKYHPNPDALTQAHCRLHARNYLILESEAAPIICWTEGGKVEGGTGQALRIARDKNMNITNLGDPEILEEVIKQLKYRGYQV